MQLSDNTQFHLQQTCGPGKEEFKDEDMMFSPEFNNQTLNTNHNTAFDDQSRIAETCRANLVQVLCGVLFQSK